MNKWHDAKKKNPPVFGGYRFKYAGCDNSNSFLAAWTPHGWVISDGGDFDGEEITVEAGDQWFGVAA